MFQNQIIVKPCRLPVRCSFGLYFTFWILLWLKKIQIRDSFTEAS